MPQAGSYLQGKQILVTRAKEQAESFSKKIEEHGGIAIEIPLIKIQAPKNTDIIEKTLQKIHTYSWLVFTSMNGVQSFFDFLKNYNIAFSEADRPKIAVVGRKTLQALEQKGFSADLIPDEFVAEDLFEKMIEAVDKSETILLARGNLGRSLLPEKLRKMGIKVDDLILYENVLNTEKQAELIYLLESRSVDIITFTSSSTVTNFVELLKETSGWRNWLEHIQIACIGPITEKTAIQAGFNPQIVATEYTVAGLLEAIVSKYRQEELR
ncbi:MAG TPA: uroporphyrinogen-III synthase [Bacillales bacterium]|nr:uroporphyrinogen-III synthase [Bacillales bacterium]